MFKIFKKNEKGYAILFTVIVISAISVITAGISNAIYKQLVLSSLANDSQKAFYQADTASDCALLFDMEERINYEEQFQNREVFSWECGGFNMEVTPDSDGISYSILPTSSVEESQEPCYRINTSKDGVTVEILANGYNICNKNNVRTVERQIKISYNE
jgi:hypothetical protein